MRRKKSTNLEGRITDYFYAYQLFLIYRWWIVISLILLMCTMSLWSRRHPKQIVEGPQIAYEQVYLGYFSRVPEGEAWVSKVLWAKYQGWTFMSYQGPCFFSKELDYPEPTILVRGDEWTLKQRKIVATIVSQVKLRDFIPHAPYLFYSEDK